MTWKLIGTFVAYDIGSKKHFSAYIAYNGNKTGAISYIWIIPREFKVEYDYCT